MKTLKITPKQLKDIVTSAFHKGEHWALCYSTWFIPSEVDHKKNLREAVANAKKQLKEQ